MTKCSFQNLSSNISFSNKASFYINSVFNLISYLDKRDAPRGWVVQAEEECPACDLALRLSAFEIGNLDSFAGPIANSGELVAERIFLNTSEFDGKYLMIDVNSRQ